MHETTFHKPSFTIVNLDTWPRREHFLHYYQHGPCSFSMTVKLDISHLKRNHIPVQPALLFILANLINKDSSLRMAFDKSHRLGYYEYLIPCFTFFHEHTQTFSTIWTETKKDFPSFLHQYRQDILSFGHNVHLEGKPQTPENIFNFSTIPWCSFESFQLHLPLAKDYFIPIFTVGKYYEEKDSFLLPFAVQVHHAVCDGFHISRLINDLQQTLYNF